MLSFRFFAYSYTVVSWLGALLVGSPLLPLSPGSAAFDIAFWALALGGMVSVVMSWLRDIPALCSPTVPTRGSDVLRVIAIVVIIGITASFLLHRLWFEQFGHYGSSVGAQIAAGLATLACVGVLENRWRRDRLFDSRGLGFRVLMLLVVTESYLGAVAVFSFGIAESVAAVALVVAGVIAIFGILCFIFALAAGTGEQDKADPMVRSVENAGHLRRS